KFRDENTNQGKQTELLCDDAADERRNAVFGDMIGRCIEVPVAFSGIVRKRRQQFVRRDLIGGDPVGARQKIEAEIAVAAKRVGVVVDALFLGIRFALVLGKQRPDQAVSSGIVRRLLGPAENLEFAEAARRTILVVLLGSILDVPQEVVGVPVPG